MDASSLLYSVFIPILVSLITSFVAHVLNFKWQQKREIQHNILNEIHSDLVTMNRNLGRLRAEMNLYFWTFLTYIKSKENADIEIKTIEDSYHEYSAILEPAVELLQAYRAEVDLSIVSLQRDIKYFRKPDKKKEDLIRLETAFSMLNDRTMYLINVFKTIQPSADRGNELAGCIHDYSKIKDDYIEILDELIENTLMYYYR